MSPRRLLLTYLILCCLLRLGLATPTLAQDPAILSLEADTTELQTGQEYVVTIRLEGVTDLWLASFEITYNPTQLYVIGTRSGSPVTQGSLLPSSSSIVLFNKVERDTLTYTLSLLNPAEPVSGGGVVGTFRIYPLTSGTSPIIFSQAEVVKAIIEETDTGVRKDTEALPFTPVLLEVSISGEPVDPPDEATATPAPTATPTLDDEATEEMVFPTEEPTLVNVTAAPATPPPVPISEPETQDDNTALTIALIVLAVSGLGLAGVALFWLRSRRR